MVQPGEVAIVKNVVANHVNVKDAAGISAGGNFRAGGTISRGIAKQDGILKTLEVVILRRGIVNPAAVARLTQFVPPVFKLGKHACRAARDIKFRKLPIGIVVLERRRFKPVGSNGTARQRRFHRPQDGTPVIGFRRVKNGIVVVVVRG